MCVFLLSTINGAVAARFDIAAAEEGNSSNKGHYTHTWAVHIPGGETVADKIAADHGFVNQGKVSKSAMFFLLKSIYQLEYLKRNVRHNKSGSIAVLTDFADFTFKSR